MDVQDVAPTETVKDSTDEVSLRDHLLRLISQAFRDTIPPRDGVFYSAEREFPVETDYLTGRSWTEIAEDEDPFIPHASDPVFLEPKDFAYYLPAFLTKALVVDESVSDLAYRLDETLVSPNPQHVSFLEYLMVEQKRVVLAYVGYRMAIIARPLVFYPHEPDVVADCLLWIGSFIHAARRWSD